MKKFQILILGVAALLTAIATLIVGPLSFVGLMAPHLAQRLGLTRGLPHLMGSALFGALLMAMADFIGRTIYFPWQLPTGLVATLLGGPVFALLLIRGRRCLCSIEGVLAGAVRVLDHEVDEGSGYAQFFRNILLRNAVDTVADECVLGAFRQSFSTS